METMRGRTPKCSKEKVVLLLVYSQEYRCMWRHEGRKGIMYYFHAYTEISVSWTRSPRTCLAKEFWGQTKSASWAFLTEELVPFSPSSQLSRESELDKSDAATWACSPTVEFSSVNLPKRIEFALWIATFAEFRSLSVMLSDCSTTSCFATDNQASPYRGSMMIDRLVAKLELLSVSSTAPKVSSSRDISTVPGALFDVIE